MMVSEKSESALPPKKKRTRTAVNVVTDVSTVLERVALIAAFIMSFTSPRWFCRLSRIRSNTTMVSLMEYPAMVRNAPMWMSESSSPIMNRMPRQMRMSWSRAKNAPTANENSNLTVM